MPSDPSNRLPPAAAAGPRAAVTTGPGARAPTRASAAGHASTDSDTASAASDKVDADYFRKEDMYEKALRTGLGVTSNWHGPGRTWTGAGAGLARSESDSDRLSLSGGVRAQLEGLKMV